MRLSEMIEEVLSVIKIPLNTERICRVRESLNLISINELEKSETTQNCPLSLTSIK